MLTIWSVFIGISLTAQKQGHEPREFNAYDQTYAEMHYWDYKLSSAADTAMIKDVLARELNLNERDELRVVSIKKSLTATHITFSQFYQGVAIVGGGAKVAISNNNVLFRCIETVFPTNGTMPGLPANFNAEQALAGYANLNILTSKPAYLWDGSRLKAGWYATFLHDEVGCKDAAWWADGSEYFTRDLNRYFDGPDSTVTVDVFDPDPITPVNAVYGGQYVDLNDGNTAILDPLRVTKQVKVEYDAGIFRLKSDYVEIIEFSAPSIQPVTTTQPNFSFSRTADGFEQTNAYYHIMNYQAYLQSLGYELVDYAIHVDAQGFGGADNSAFTPGTNPPRLTFGEGGVDDAEDADVVVHEYGHAISEDASPYTNNGIERRSLDEAFGDYVAVSYTRDVYSFGKTKVFNWDGHNIFWNGRTVDNPENFCYTDISFTDIYRYTTLWNAAMFEIWDQLGKTYTDKLQIEALHGYFQNMNYRQAALMVIDADTALTGGVNALTIWQAFDNVCILDWSDVDEHSTSAKAPYQLQNTAFGGDQNIKLIVNNGTGEGSLHLYDLNGRLLTTQKLVEGENIIDTKAISAAGVYLLSLEIGNQAYSERVVRID